MNDLAEALARRIRDEGPISLADYMAAASAHYYAHRDPFGARGDFVTAPEISQMFGELIGLWCVATWRAMGAPPRFVLAELGPGRGTLMQDALRAALLAPDFRHAAELHLVETSEVLRQRQRDALEEYRPQWHARAEELPDGPLLLVANEFFDALPVRQFKRDERGWYERRVGIADERFVFARGAICADIGDAPVGAIRERSPDGEILAAWLGNRVATQGGAALLVDYGYADESAGDTVQALKAHRRHDPLADPGEADVTAHVDFAALARAAGNTGARIFGPIAQGMFLHRLGVATRAAKLMDSSPAQATTVAAALRRLTDPDAMGALFKVMAIANSALPPLAGFA